MNYILLDDKILEMYGFVEKCLYCKETLYEWLETTSDKGEFYNILEKRLNGVMLNSIKSNILQYDKWFHNFINDNGNNDTVISPTVFDEIIGYFENYEKPRTRIAKLKFSEIHDKIFMLSNVSCIPINQYISARYKICIQDDISNVHVSSEYFTNIKQVEILVENLHNEKTFIINKTKYLNNKVYNFNIENYKQYIINHREIHHEYVKLWSKLSIPERENRIRHYVFTRVSIDESIIDDIIESYRNKEILYRNIKWNVKYGEIDDITNIIDGIVQVKNKVILTSVFSVHEKNINECILFQLVSSNNQASYENVLESISKLCNTKLNQPDKKLIKQRYNVMKETIENYESFE
jgi:hypothetical protein